MAGVKLFLLLVLFPLMVKGQITSGRIVYERKTNLMKTVGQNPRMKNFITEENKYRIEQFELFFNDSLSVYKNIPSGESEQGFMKYMTTRNTVYQDLTSMEKLIIMDLWGNETLLKDSIQKRQWKVTESKRKISNYQCRKAIWEMNDSTRIYAWFTPDIVPPVGPEGFGGLPGTILGLASEDGGIVYFAKEVIAVKPPEDSFTYDTKGKTTYTKEQLKAILIEKMGQWVKPKDLDGMFSWL